MAINVNQLADEEYFIGHKACQGCDASLVIRLALKVFGPRTYPSCRPTACPREKIRKNWLDG